MPSSEAWSLESKAARREARREQYEFAAELPAKYEGRAPGGNWQLWAIPLLLSLAGVVMIASLTSRSGQAGELAFYWQAFRQFRFLICGLVLMYLCCFVPLSWMRRLSFLLWILAVALTTATLFPSLGGVRVGGASRWLILLGLQFQPLEILTLAVPMFLAARLSTSKREDSERFLRPTLLIAVISAAPLFFQPNMGGIILVFGICISMHVVDRGWKYPIYGGVILFLLFVLMIYSEEYRMRRLFAFLNPWDDPMNRGFQIIQGLVAFSNGGVMGIGIGRGLQTLNFLPAAQTDYIFPAIGEEFGLVGTLFIVLLYAFWTFKAYMLYRSSDDPYISVLIWGLVASILFPMFVNLGGVMKLMPLTGIPLPFVSLGGTSLIIMWAKVGILMRIAREISLPVHVHSNQQDREAVPASRHRNSEFVLAREPAFYREPAFPAARGQVAWGISPARNKVWNLPPRKRP